MYVDIMTAVPRMSGRHAVRTTAVAGVDTFCPASTASRKTGVSSSRNRT